MSARFLMSKDGRHVFVAEHVRGPEHFRPVAVIDPENPEDVERLADAWDDAHYSGPLPDERMPLRDLRMRAALRQFATPTAPRPVEPTGLGAVVEDDRGGRWVRRYTDPRRRACWVRDNSTGFQPYSDIAAVRVLSEGVR